VLKILFLQRPSGRFDRKTVINRGDGYTFRGLFYTCIQITYYLINYLKN